MGQIRAAELVHRARIYHNNVTTLIGFTQDGHYCFVSVCATPYIGPTPAVEDTYWQLWEETNPIWISLSTRLQSKTREKNLKNVISSIGVFLHRGTYGLLWRLPTCGGRYCERLGGCTEYSVVDDLGTLSVEGRSARCILILGIPRDLEARTGIETWLKHVTILQHNVEIPDPWDLTA